GGVRDEAKMLQGTQPLEDPMRSTDRVHSTGPGPDLAFSLKDIGAVGCWGERNIPDGECFSCPVKDSVNGTVQYNCETLYRGTIFNNIKLTFKNGKVVNGVAGSTSMTEKLNEILEADEGAGQLGE